MILKGSQRGGAPQLAAHLLKDENDHVTVQEIRGFVAGDLQGALKEAYAVSKGTRCRQFMFSLSLNPPKDGEISIDELVGVADRAEETLGLKDQPRAIVIHEKNGRRHAHVVWSRIDPEEMKAINLPYYKNRLKELSRELYLEHGWDLPEGHKTNGWKNPLNFSLAEWQQAKRIDLDPREVKQVFREAWFQSDNLASFKNALEEHGYYLARGDRRGTVAVDLNGEVLSVARWAGVKNRDLTARLHGLDRLPAVEQVRSELGKQRVKRYRDVLNADRDQKNEALKPLKDELQQMVAGQRMERARLLEGQSERWQKETRARAARFGTGFGKVMDILTGRLFTVRRENEREAYQSFVRDRGQRERLYDAQLKERRTLQIRIAEMQLRHRHDRMRLARQVADLLRYEGRDRGGPDPQASRSLQSAPEP